MTEHSETLNLTDRGSPFSSLLVPFLFQMLAINLTGNYAQIGAHTMNESILLLNDDIWNWGQVTHSFGRRRPSFSRCNKPRIPAHDTVAILCLLF